MKDQQPFPDSVRWRTLGVASTGRGHVLSGEPCQDHHKMASLLNGDLVVIVADGAGSAEFSDEGARVASETCLSLIAEQSRERPLSERDYHRIFMATARSVVHYARSFQLSPRKFASTLNVLHITQYGIFNASIGDSGCLVQLDKDELKLLAKPFKGRYTNETAFLTPRMVEKYFAFGSSDAPVKGFIAATDGIFDLLYQQDRINAASANALMECLRKQELPRAQQELETFFQSQTLARFTRDDLTLVIGHSTTEGC